MKTFLVVNPSSANGETGKRWPQLAAHSDTCESLEAFSGVVQPFHVTPPKG